MRIRRIMISAAFAAGLASLPLSIAKAQYYPPCSPFPLAWPFYVAGAVVGTAAMIVTARVRALTALLLRLLLAALLPAINLSSVQLLSSPEFYQLPMRIKYSS